MLGGLKYLKDKKNIEKTPHNLPIYFFSGMDDPVGNYGRGVLEAYFSLVKAGCEDVSIKLFPHGRHEMLTDINRQQVFEDVNSWIKSKTEAKNSKIKSS